MARKKRPLPLLESIEIADTAAEGKAIARVGERVVFVPFAAPGDVVDIQVTKRRKNYYEGRVVKVHHYSDRRVKPVCEHFGDCGGCKWQHLSYADQLAMKQQQVLDNFQRLGKFTFPPIQPILGSEKTEYYRNKLDFSFSNRRWLTQRDMDEGTQYKNMDALGFHVPKLFDRVIDVDHCFLQPDPSNAIRLALRDYGREKEYPFYDARNNVGFLRNIIIRNSALGHWMVVMVFANNNPEHIEDVMQFLHQQFPVITSLHWVINTKTNDAIADLDIHCYAGDSFMTEQMEDLQFKVGPKSFYQTNSHQAYELYKVGRDFAALDGSQVVYDLYTGTGTIANFIARNAQKVVGIEYVEAAIDDARENSRINSIDNTVFYAGDMADVLTTDFVHQNGRPDVIITDPPRAGMHPKVVAQILKATPRRIVYISCNPATQARDIALMDEDYVVEAVQPVDMFPHTHHVENVVLLVRK